MILNQNSENAWEQRKLGECCQIMKGLGLSKTMIEKGGLKKCILYGHLYTEYGMFIKDVKYGSLVDLKNPVYSEKGDVLVPASDTTPFGCARAASVDKSGIIIGGDINIIRPMDEIDGDYLSLVINHEKASLIQMIRGTTVRHLNSSDLSDLVIQLPADVIGQSRIANVFICIDNLITLHQ